jgi:hypothetical protein
MGSCEEVRTQVAELTACPTTKIPAGLAEHLAGCPACARTLAAARLTRGLLAAAAEAPEPPAEFATRVMAAVPGARPSRPEAEMWRLGWGLMPAFGAAVALLVILYQYQASPISPSFGLVPMEGLSAGEQLVLESSPPEQDVVLTAVMEGSGT